MLVAMKYVINHTTTTSLRHSAAWILAAPLCISTLTIQPMFLLGVIRHGSKAPKAMVIPVGRLVKRS